MWQRGVNTAGRGAQLADGAPGPAVDRLHQAAPARERGAAGGGGDDGDGVVMMVMVMVVMMIKWTSSIKSRCTPHRVVRYIFIFYYF